MNAYRHCSKVRPTALCRLAGFFNTGNVDFTWDSGTTRTPSVGAELSATPDAPWPWSSRIWVNAPPAEWPMMIGGRSSSAISFSILAMIAGTVTSAMICGFSRSASTSTSKPG